MSSPFGRGSVGREPWQTADDRVSTLRVMRPLPIMAAGVAIVAVDLRVDRFDLLLDPVGWLLVAEGARRLSLRVPALLACVAAALSVAEISLPYHLQRVDPVSGAVLSEAEGARRNVAQHLVFDPVSGGHLVLLVLAMVVGGITLWVLLEAMEARARATDARRADQFRWLRWLVAAVWVLPFLLVAAVQASGDGFDPVWNDGLGYIALAGMVPLGLVVVLLVSESGKRWALPPAPALRPLTD
jgi:hypothetical protein